MQATVSYLGTKAELKFDSELHESQSKKGKHIQLHNLRVYRENTSVIQG